MRAVGRTSDAGTSGFGAQAAVARDPVIDVARGAAMILVVLGHALVGAVSAGQEAPVYRFLLLMIYSTHMALFFLLSGALSAGVAARPWPAVLRRLAQRILWPYLLWSLVLVSAHYVMSDFTNTALDGFHPERILWRPPAVMWFLYVLFFGLLALRLLAPLPPALTVGLGAACLAAPYLAAALPQEIRFVGLFLLAAAAGQSRLRGLAAPWPAAVALLVMVGTVLIAWQEARQPIDGYPAATAAYIPALLAGPIVILALSALLARIGGGMAAALDYIGRRTMPIFVTHILATAGTRIVLRAAGLDDWTLIVLAGTVAGVILPLVAAALAERWRLSGLLGWR